MISSAMGIVRCVRSKFDAHIGTLLSFCPPPQTLWLARAVASRHSGMASVGMSRGTPGGRWPRDGCGFPIPRPAAPAVGLVSNSRFPLAGLVSSFPRNVGGRDLPDSVGPTELPSQRHLVLPFPFSTILTLLLHNFSFEQISVVNMAPHADNGQNDADNKPSTLAPLEPGIPEVEAKVKMPAFPQ